jgi:hypothetical protein
MERCGFILPTPHNSVALVRADSNTIKKNFTEPSKSLQTASYLLNDKLSSVNDVIVT